jgi:hypothetical protein
MNSTFVVRIRKIIRSRASDETRRSEAGDTLVEVLLAIIILGLTSVSILLAFATSISGSATHRNLATMDTVLRTAAEETISQIQQQSNAQFATCPVPDVVTPSLPAGWQMTMAPTVNGVAYATEYWTTTTSPPSFSATGCVPGTIAAPQVNSPQLVTITVTSPTGSVSNPLSFVVDDPSAKPVPAAGPASQLAFLTSPVSTTAGTALTVQVAVEDASGNYVTTDFSAPTLSITPNTGTSGASLSNTCSGTEYNGVVTYAGCSIGTIGNSYTLKVTDTENLPSGAVTLTPATSGAFNIGASPVTQLVFNPGTPGPGTAGSALPNVTVQAEDAYGDLSTATTGSVTVGVQSGSPQTGFSSGTATVALTHGVATFSSLVLNTSGTYVLTAAPVNVTGGSGTITSAISGSFVVSPAAPHSFSVANPGSQTVGNSFSDTITALDLYGNTATSVTGAQSMSFSGPANGSGGVTPVYPASVTFTSGVGTASGITLFDVQSATLRATGASITGLSGSFAVGKAIPSDVVTNSSSPSLGSPVTFTATLGGPTGMVNPTGTVTWSVSGTAASGVSCATSSLTSGTATCSFTVNNAGTYIVSDAYVPSTDPNYAPVTSVADSVSVGFTPTVLQVESKSGGTSGLLQGGDHIGVTFPVAINAGSICSGKTGTFNISGTTTILTNAAPGTLDDELIFAPASGQCGTSTTVGFASGGSGANAGYIDLGSQNFVGTTSAMIASSSLTFNATTNNIQLTFGPTISGGTPLTAVSNATAVYHPDSAIQSTTGASVSGSASATNIFTVFQPTATSIAGVPVTPTNGIPGNGDAIVYSFSEQMDPNSILSGWGGGSTPVVACFTRANGANAPTLLTIAQTTCSTPLGLGSVNLGDGGAYMARKSTIPLTATMSMATGSTSVVTVSLGATSGSFTAVSGTTSWTWTPTPSTAADVAGNGLSATVPAATTPKKTFSILHPAPDTAVWGTTNFSKWFVNMTKIATV